MDHSYYQDRISAFHDRELTDYEEQAVREHLGQCEECRAMLARLGELDDLVEEQSGLGEGEYWEQAARRIQSKVANGTDTEREGASSAWFGMGWKITAAAASVAFLTFIGLHQTDIYDTDKEGFVYKPTVEFPIVKEDSGSDKVLTPIEDGADDLGRDEKVIDQVGSTATRLEDKESSVPRKSDEITKGEISRAPVTTVDELLTDVAGVITNDQGEVFIRGGRAGEVSYIVDGVPVDDSPSETGEVGTKPELDKVISIKGRRDKLAEREIETAPAPRTEAEAKQRIMSKDMTAQSAARTDNAVLMLPKMVQDSVTDPLNVEKDLGQSFDAATELNLDGWIHRRDSLETRWNELDKKENKLTVAPSSKMKSLDRARDVERKLLESYYNVARLAEGQNQEVYDDAVEYLQDYLLREGSRHPRMARDYLRRLGLGAK